MLLLGILVEGPQPHGDWRAVDRVGAAEGGDVLGQRAEDGVEQLLSDLSIWSKEDDDDWLIDLGGWAASFMIGNLLWFLPVEGNIFKDWKWFWGWIGRERWVVCCSQGET